MRVFLMAMLFPPCLMAAEFMLDGKKVVSEVTEKAVNCGRFNILLREERFPVKYGMRIPPSFSIKNFYGGDFIIGADAFFVSENAKYRLPYANEVKGLKDRLRKATYIPISADCTKEGFFVQYWSGGNGRGSEAGISYSVSESGKVSAPMWFGEDEFLSTYAK